MNSSSIRRHGCVPVLDSKTSQWRPSAAASQRFELQRPDQAGVKQANAVLGFEIGLRRHGVFPCRSVRGVILVRAVAFPEPASAARAVQLIVICQRRVVLSAVGATGG